MSASLGILLIFHEERGYACTLEFTDGICDLGKITVAGVGISDDGQRGHSGGNPTGLTHRFLTRQETPVRAGKQGSGDGGTADAHSQKPRIFNQPRRKGVVGKRDNQRVGSTQEFPEVFT
jgi:hypothetical protein